MVPERACEPNDYKWAKSLIALCRSEAPIWNLVQGTLFGIDDRYHYRIHLWPDPIAVGLPVDGGDPLPYCPTLKLDESLPRPTSIIPDWKQLTLRGIRGERGHPVFPPSPSMDGPVRWWISQLPRTLREHVWMFEQDLWWYLCMCVRAPMGWARLLREMPLFCRVLCESCELFPEGDPASAEFPELVREVREGDLSALLLRVGLNGGDKWACAFFREALPEACDPQFRYSEFCEWLEDPEIRYAFSILRGFSPHIHRVVSRTWKHPLVTADFLLDLASRSPTDSEWFKDLMFLEELQTVLKAGSLAVRSLDDLQQTLTSLWTVYQDPLCQLFGDDVFPAAPFRLGYGRPQVRTIHELLELCRDVRTLWPLFSVYRLCNGGRLVFSSTNPHRTLTLLSLEWDPDWETWLSHFDWQDVPSEEQQEEERWRVVHACESMNIPVDNPDKTS